MGSTGLRQLHLALFVYGPRYLDVCATVAFPNILSQILDLPEDLRSITKLRILTDDTGRARLEQSPALGRIGRLIDVNMDDTLAIAPDRQHGYLPMIAGQSKLVYEASLQDAGIIFCPPDLVWSRGAFTRIARLAQNGYRAVIGPSARGIDEDLAPIFQRAIAASEADRLDISSQELGEYLFSHWQQMNNGFIWNQAKSNVWKSYAYWRVGDRQLLMKYWQGPALFLWPSRVVKDYDGWIDHRLIKACARAQREIYVVRDAHEIFTVDLAPRDRQEGHVLSPRKRWDLFVQLLNRKRHCRFNIVSGFRSTRIYTAPLSEKLWREAERGFGRQTAPSMIAAIVARPIMAVADGAWRHSGLAGTAAGLRRRCGALYRCVGIRKTIGEIRYRLRIRTRVQKLLRQLRPEP
jgi:hypothetical protein